MTNESQGARAKRAVPPPRRRPDPRIVDPAAEKDRFVNQTVAAEFLQMHRSAVAAYIDEGHLRYEWRGRRKMIRVEELVRFQFWLRRLAGADRSRHSVRPSAN